MIRLTWNIPRQRLNLQSSESSNRYEAMRSPRAGRYSAWPPPNGVHLPRRFGRTETADNAAHRCPIDHMSFTVMIPATGCAAIQRFQKNVGRWATGASLGSAERLQEKFSKGPGIFGRGCRMMNLEELRLEQMLFSKKRRTDEFEAFALPHLNDIYRTAARLLGGGGTGADDVVQDVYLQAWKSFDQFELGTNCRAWLYKILFHTLNHYRRKWLNFRMVKESEEILEFAASATPPLPEHITDEQMLAALADVPQDFRAVV